MENSAPKKENNKQFHCIISLSIRKIVSSFGKMVTKMQKNGLNTILSQVHQLDNYYI